jgi:hypothetical protein
MAMTYQTIPVQTEPKRIARWESRGGNRAVGNIGSTYSSIQLSIFATAKP